MSLSISILFHEIFYRPLLNFLVILQNTIPGHDFGLAIIVLTVLIRLLLWPLASQSIRSQKVMQEIQPELNALKEKYKNNKEQQAREMMELYKKKNINPASGCLPLVIQMPILIALYYALWAGLKSSLGDSLYSFVHLSAGINFVFLGIIDLSKPNIVLAVLTGILQYYQTRMLMAGKKNNSNANAGAGDFSKMMNTQMLYVMPVIMAFFAASLPAGLALYLITTTAFSVAQQYFVIKKN